MQLPVPWPKLYCWAINSATHCLTSYQTGHSCIAKQYRYLRELRLILYRLSNFTYSHSLSLSLFSLYTQHYIQCYNYNHTTQIQKCQAHLGDALFARPGPHSLHLHNTISKYTRKKTRLIIRVRKTRIKRSRSIARKLVQYLQTNVQLFLGRINVTHGTALATGLFFLDEEDA